MGKTRRNGPTPPGEASRTRPPAEEAAPPEVRPTAVWVGATEVLSRDPVFGPLVARIGPVWLPPTEDAPFPALVRAIVYQQLAGAAARTIHGRVLGVLGEVTPGTVLATPAERLRGAGLSANKLAAIMDLSTRSSDGRLDLSSLAGLPDDDVVARLVTVRGIGPWTAQMHLMFQLRRPDVWPTGDLGVRAGWSRIHGLPEPITPADLARSGEAHRPWRSAAAWYCWRAVDTLLPSEPESEER